MTIIKKRGRIVRNIFVIDRYDVPTGCWEEMLSRTYSVDPNADRRAVCRYIQRSFSDPEDREVKMESYRVRNTPLSSFECQKGSCANYVREDFQQPFGRNGNVGHSRTHNKWRVINEDGSVYEKIITKARYGRGIA